MLIYRVEILWRKAYLEEVVEDEEAPSANTPALPDPRPFDELAAGAADDAAGFALLGAAAPGELVSLDERYVFP